MTEKDNHAMLNRLISFSLKNRLLVCIFAGFLILYGGRSLLNLPVDAFPDTTPVQVQINTTAPALNPEEAEQQITMPIEQAVSGLPGLANLRSISKFGLSQVVATFEDGTSIYLARQLISERLQGVELPEGIGRPELGPISTGLGEVFHYAVRSTDPARTLTELREIQDWVIKPQLRKVRGVAEVNTWGGLEKQFHVVVDPAASAQVWASPSSNWRKPCRRTTRTSAAARWCGPASRCWSTAIGLATDIQATRRHRDHRARGQLRCGCATWPPCKVDHEIRRGAVTGDGRGEIVLGLGFMLMGENSAVVTHALKDKLAEVQQSLPEDVQGRGPLRPHRTGGQGDPHGRRKTCRSARC